MTFKKLSELIKKYKIPENVRLQSDSGWECSETEMDGVFYNKKTNTIIFTQEFQEEKTLLNGEKYFSYEPDGYDGKPNEWLPLK